MITSPLTFSSDIAPLVRSGIVPAFVDVEADTFQIDVDAIEEMIGPRTKAILTPNLVGNCPDWDRIRAIADAHGLAGRRGLLRRARLVAPRHAHRAARRHRGAPASPASHSMTAAGNGGMIAVDDPEWFDRRWCAGAGAAAPRPTCSAVARASDDRFGPLADGTPYDLIFVFDDMGYNFEPSEIMAAYGLVQMDKLGELQRTTSARPSSHR